MPGGECIGPRDDQSSEGSSGKHTQNSDFFATVLLLLRILVENRSLSLGDSQGLSQIGRS